MPVISLTLYKGRPSAEKELICQTILQTMKDCFSIQHNNFHCRINEYDKDELLIPEASSANYLSIEIDSFPGKTPDQKTELYHRLEERLAAFSIARNDILIIFREPALENWYIRGKSGTEMR